MAKRKSDSARSLDMGIVRRDNTRRRWSVVASVVRFVGHLVRLVTPRAENNLEMLNQEVSVDSSNTSSQFYDPSDFMCDERFFTKTMDCTDFWPISDSSNDGQAGDFVCSAGKYDYTGSPHCSILCNKSWQKGDLLGSGSIGCVYEGFTEDGFFFAVKEVLLLDHGKQIRSHLEQEISLLRQFRHKNIVRYLGTDKDDAKLYIFLQLVTKGSLVKLYEKYKLGDSQVSAYTRQILNGLNYLHSQNVVHRDIKCANILVAASGSVKLADFGLAKISTLNDIKSCKGSPRWMAPEVVNHKGNRGYGCAADIWSLGCTVLEMLTGQFPYSNLESMQALFRIGRGELPRIPNTLSYLAQDFILKCLEVNPDDRPTAAQLLEHPFVKKPSSTFPSPVSRIMVPCLEHISA